MDMEELLGRNNRARSIKARSAIYVWGYNQSGQTGRKDRDRLLRIPKQLSPQLFGSNSRWLDIACGREHTAAVDSDGSLFTWGANEFGQLGAEEGTTVLLRSNMQGFRISLIRNDGVLVLNGVSVVIIPEMYSSHWLVVHGISEVLEEWRGV